MRFFHFVFNFPVFGVASDIESYKESEYHVAAMEELGEVRTV